MELTTHTRSRPAGASESERRPESPARHGGLRLPRFSPLIRLARRSAAALLVLLAFAAFAPHGPAHAQTADTLPWSTNMTPGMTGSSVGYLDAGDHGSSIDSSRIFVVDGTTYGLQNLYRRNDGKLVLQFQWQTTQVNPRLPARNFVLRVGTVAVDFHGHNDYDSGFGGRYLLDAPGLTLTVGTPVAVSLDQWPELTISAAKSPVTEGTDDNVEFTITADRAPASTLTVKVNAAYEGNLIFTPNRFFDLRLPGGQSSWTWTRSILDDTTQEPDGSMTATLQPGTGYTVGDPASATVRIYDDESPPRTLTIDSPSVEEGDSGHQEVTLTATLSAPAREAVTVTMRARAVTTGLPNRAMFGAPSVQGDIRFYSFNRTITIPAGQSTGTTTVRVWGDTRSENDEIAYMEAFSITNAQFPENARLYRFTVTILDDDSSVVTIGRVDRSVTEGEAARFRVTADPAPSSDLTVHVDIAATGIFGVLTNRRATTIKANENSAIVRVLTDGDDEEETHGSVTATLPQGTDYRVGEPDSATVEIRDDDGANASLNSPPEITRVYFSTGGLSYTRRLRGDTPTVVSGTVFSAGYDAYDRDDPKHDRNKNGIHDRDGRPVVEDAGIRHRYIKWTGGLRPMDPTGYAEIERRWWHGIGALRPSSFMVAPHVTQAQVTAGTNCMEFTAYVWDREGESHELTKSLCVTPRYPTVVVHGWNRQDRAGRFPNFRQWECRTALMSAAQSYGGFYYEYSGRTWDFTVPLTEYTWTQMEGDTVTLLDGKGQPLGNRKTEKWVTFKAPPVDGATEEEKVLKFKMTVKDANGLTAHRDFYYTISHLDRDPTAEPVAEAGLDINTFAGTTALLRARGRSVACQGTISAPGTSPGEAGGRVTFHWEQVSGPAVPLPDPSRQELRVPVPPDASPGTVYTFQVTVTDEGGRTDTDFASVTVEGDTPPGDTGPEGTPPTANAGPDLEALPGTTVTLQGRDSTNPHGAWHQLAHLWAQHEGPEVELSDPTRGDPSFAVPADTPVGTAFRFALTVTDEEGETDTDETTVTVVAALGATPPTANAGPDLEGEPGETVTLQGKGSINPHGKWWRMAHLWTQTAGPEVTLSDPTRGLPSFTVPSDAAPGTVFGFELTVTDKDGESDTDAMTVTVPGGAPPVAADAGPDLAVAPGATATLGAEAEAVEGWTYAWTQTSGPSVTLTGADAPRASFAVPADAADGAVYAFSLTVTDAHGNTATDAAEATVSATPVLTVDAPSVEEGGPGARTALTFTLRLDRASVRALSPRVRVTGTGSAAYLRADDPATATGGDGTDVLGRVRADRLAAGAVTFAPGATEAALTFTVLGDVRLEEDETLVVAFAPVDGLALPGGAPSLLARGTIVNDDVAPPVTADAGPDLELEPGGTATLGVEAEPVEGADWTWAWTQTSGPEVALTGADTPRASFAVPADAADGTAFAFSLRVTDAYGGEAVDETAVTVARTASACATSLGSLAVGGSAGRSAQYWDNPACRAHHRVDRPARYFRFTLTERATVSIDLATDADAALFVSKGEPKNGWGTPAKAGMAHRLQVRRDNGKLVHGAALSASLVLAPGSYTAEAVLDADGPVAWRVPSFSLNVAATPPPAAVSVADARVEEAPNAVLSFAVTLDYAAPATATVSWATSDGTAVAGEDYTAGSGTLTFAPGETSKTVEVAVLDDAHDEGEETMTLTLSNADGVLAGDMEATGTIANEDPLLNAWLSRFGRTVASQTVEALTERFAAPPGAGSHVTLGGQRIGLSSSGGTGADVPGTGPGQPGPLLTALAAAGQPDAGWPSGTGSVPAAGGIPGSPGTAEPRSMTARDLLLGSSFRLSAGGGNSGSAPRWTAWGRAALERFENSGGGVPLDGEVVTGVFGADRESRNWLAGVALTHSVGEGGMRPRGMAMEYDVDSELTAVHPYVRLRLSDRLSAWVLAGYGQGDLTLTQKREAGGADGEGAGTGRTAWKTDTAMTLGAAGARGDVLVPAEAGGFGLALRGDAFWVRTTSDPISDVEDLGNLAGADADASRVRLVLEGSRVLTLGSGATFTPSLEVGVRHDGGDAESGAGMELGGSLRYADPASGLAADVSARTLLTHGDGDYREWGVSGALRWAPGARGRGLSLTLTPAYGADAGGTDRLWSARDAAALAPAGGNTDPAARLEAEAGYGLAAFGDAFTGTPYAGFGYSDAERRYRLGWRLTRADDPGPFAFSLEASRRESANDHEPEHGIGFRLTRRW